MSALLVAALLAMSPFEKNDPLIDDGITAFKGEKYDEAVAKFEAAARERPNDPRAQFNLAAALHKLGRNADAKQALTKAEELDSSKHEYTNQIQYNRGTIAASEDQKDEAVKAYRKALRADPSDELSRHNLEVVLRGLPPKPKPGPDGGTDGGGGGDAGAGDGGQGQQDGGNDGGRNDGGADGGASDAGRPADGGKPGDAGSGDGGSGDGGQGEKEQPGDGGQGDGQRGDAGSDGGQRSDAGAEDESDQPTMQPDGGMGLSRKEAEKALDSMKNGEKNLQLWRFRQKTQKNENNGKDW